MGTRGAGTLGLRFPIAAPEVDGARPCGANAFYMICVLGGGWALCLCVLKLKLVCMVHRTHTYILTTSRPFRWAANLAIACHDVTSHNDRRLMRISKHGAYTPTKSTQTMTTSLSRYAFAAPCASPSCIPFLPAASCQPAACFCRRALCGRIERHRMCGIINHHHIWRACTIVVVVVVVASALGWCSFFSPPTICKMDTTHMYATHL